MKDRRLIFIVLWPQATLRTDLTTFEFILFHSSSLSCRSFKLVQWSTSLCPLIIKFITLQQRLVVLFLPFMGSSNIFSHLLHTTNAYNVGRNDAPIFFHCGFAVCTSNSTQKFDAINVKLMLHVCLHNVLSTGWEEQQRENKKWYFAEGRCS